MTLINRTDFPPQGYLYFEPALNWRASRELASQGLDIVARALQQARVNNPQAGLDPSYEACVEAVGAYTCARLSPRLRAIYCGGEPATEQEKAQVEAARKSAGKPRGCGGCGGRR